jgi:hypothetical protein
VLGIESLQSNAKRKKLLQSAGTTTDASVVALSFSHETGVHRRLCVRGRRWLYDNDRD